MEELHHKIPSLLNSKRKRENIKKNNKIIPYFTENHEYYLSLIKEKKCYFCQSSEQENELIQCHRCFKFFHKNCYQNIEEFYNNQNICFCILEKENKCFKCKKLILSDKQLFITCELCGNKFHMECSYIPPYLIFNRDFYLQYFSDNHEIFNKFLNHIKELDAKIKPEYFNSNYFLELMIKSGFNENISKNFLKNLFYICDICKYKPNFKFNPTIYKFTLISFFNYNINCGYLHQILHTCTMLIEDDVKINKNIFLKKIVNEYYLNEKNLNRKYYLCKWSNNTFSIELDRFINNYKEFKDRLIEYEQLKKNEKIKVFPNQMLYNNYINNYNKNNNYNFNNNLFVLLSDLNDFRQSIIEFFNYVFDNKIYEPRILILIDNDTNKNFYIKTIKNISYCEINENFEEIIYELINYNNENKINNSLFEIFHKVKQNEIDEKKILNILQEMNIQSNNQIKSNVVFVSDNIHNKIINLLLYFKFHCIFFDIQNKENFFKYLNIIKSLATEKNINNNSTIYFLLNNKENFDINKNYLNYPNLFFGNFAMESEILLIDHSKTKFVSNLKYFNYKLKKYSSETSQRTVKINNKIWKLILDEESSPINIIKNLYSNNLIIYYSPSLYNFSKVIINFIPIIIDRETFIQYLYLIKYKKDIFTKSNDNKKDLMKALLTMCSFPSTLGKFYLNFLEEIKLPVKNDVIPVKIDVLYNLIKNIYLNNKNNIFEIYLIFTSEERFVDESRDYLKKIVSSNKLNELMNIHILYINELTDLVFNRIENKSYFILFNLFFLKNNHISYIKN